LRDRHVRIQERGELIWMVELETAPGLDGKHLAAWRAAFMDAPLGPPPVEATRKTCKGCGKHR